MDLPNEIRLNRLTSAFAVIDSTQRQIPANRELARRNEFLIKILFRFGVEGILSFRFVGIDGVLCDSRVVAG